VEAPLTRIASQSDLSPQERGEVKRNSYDAAALASVGFATLNCFRSVGL
jgi:hypothetical protein